LAESTSPSKHPARFSKAVLTAIRPHLLNLTPTQVHDPFAGPGNRLAALCDDLGIPFSGCDIEDWPGKDHRVIVGDSTEVGTYPLVPFVVVTSPVYPNGMADHFLPKDTSKRYTYRTSLGRPLHVNNAGRYSVRRGGSAETQYWTIQRQAVRHWQGYPALVNVSDFIFKHQVYPLVAAWRGLLWQHGYTVTTFEVTTPRMRNGANRTVRAKGEALLIALPAVV
jgi:hypothetical protein